MRDAAPDERIVTFVPGLVPEDSLAGHWLAQVTLRLRREVAWIWRERGLTPATASGSLPPTVDRAVEALDLSRHAAARRSFFANDETGGYLSARIAEPVPDPQRRPPRGSFSWIVKRLELDPVASFAFALALAPGFDSAMGSVIAACQNDTTATLPTLGLAQRLWDDPAEILTLAEPGHPLFRMGLLRSTEPEGSSSLVTQWRAGLTVPILIARRVLTPSVGMPALLSGLRPARGTSASVPPALLRRRNRGLEVVPVIGPRGADHGSVAARVSEATGRKLAVFGGAPSDLLGGGLFDALASLAWLRNYDLFMDFDTTEGLLAGPSPILPSWSIPARLFVSVAEATDAAKVPSSVRLPPASAPALGYEERVKLWRRELGAPAKKIGPEIAALSRRFRLEAAPIRSISDSFGGDQVPTFEQLASACRAELELDVGELAEKIVPRFESQELVLPHKQSLQLDEIRHAMRSIPEVHYQWGTAKAWNESGLSVLFAGPPGTGKTMAAEVLANDLDLPLYRIDLSQVVNKYIGETEKNLKRVFDACEASDLILLFDEADSLFGRRTEVKDAHDRYANLEISYLLSRMERSKGLTILATNRKKDLDDAFLRRLRYVVDFPVPDVAERRKIWTVTIPPGVDARDVDIVFLAERFQLAGGYIRSAVFNACLQSAAKRGRRARRKLSMEDVLVAVRRELEKANRAVSLERFGPHADLMSSLEHSEGAN